MLKTPKSSPSGRPSSAESLPSKPIEHIAYIEALKTYLAEHGRSDLGVKVDAGKVYAVEGFLLREIQAAESQKDPAALKQLRLLLRASNWKALVPDRQEVEFLAQAASSNLKAELKILAQETGGPWEAAEDRPDLEKAIELISASSTVKPDQLEEALELALKWVHERRDKDTSFLASESSKGYPNMAKKSQGHRKQLDVILGQLRQVRDSVLFRLLYPERAALANQSGSATAAKKASG